MDQETKEKLILALTEDQAKSLVETYDLEFWEVEEFLDKAQKGLMQMLKKGEL